jgi:hypothetical protein
VRLPSAAGTKDAKRHNVRCRPDSSTIAIAPDVSVPGAGRGRDGFWLTCLPPSSDSSCYVRSASRRLPERLQLLIGKNRDDH